MHELTVTQAALDLVLDAAAEAAADRVLSVELVVGELAGIVDESVRFYFEQLSRGTPAEGSLLNLRREPAKLECLSCGQVSAVAPPLPAECANCGSWELRVSGGREFYVASIEVPGAPAAGQA